LFLEEILNAVFSCRMRFRLSLKSIGLAHTSIRCDSLSSESHRGRILQRLRDGKSLHHYIKIITETKQSKRHSQKLEDGLQRPSVDMDAFAASKACCDLYL